MTDSTTADSIHTFTGQFELRNWREARRIETPSGTIAGELAGALVSSQVASLTLAVGKPVPARPYETRIEGSLCADETSLPINLSLDRADRASGPLKVREHSLWLGLELRRNRVTATLFARTRDDLPVEVQDFLFYRVGTKMPARRAPEKAPAPIAAPKVAVQNPATPTATPQPDPTARLAAEWTQKLRNTLLSHAENDFQSDYGSSTYIERRVALRLFDSRFVLERSTLTRVSFAGMTSSTPSRSRLTGTWTILVARASRVRLQLTSTEGEQLTYLLGAGGSESLLVDGAPWRWSR